MHTQARQQLVDLERLGDEVVCPGVERLDLIGRARATRDDDDRGRRPPAQGVDHLHPVEVRHPEVEKDDVGVRLRGEGDRRGTVGRRHHVVAVRGERDAKGPAPTAGRRRR